MIKKYNLSDESVGLLPSPHDCKIKKVKITDNFLEFYFEDDIGCYDSIKNIDPKAKSLIIRYHLIDELKVYRYKRMFRKEGYLLVKNTNLIECTNDRLEYLYTYKGYNGLVVYLWSNESIVLDISCDNVEYEWIFIKDTKRTIF